MEEEKMNEEEKTMEEVDKYCSTELDNFLGSVSDIVGDIFKQDYLKWPISQSLAYDEDRFKETLNKFVSCIKKIK